MVAERKTDLQRQYLQEDLVKRINGVEVVEEMDLLMGLD